MITILGINAYHADSSACLLRNGMLVAAAEEERFRREKHWAGLPSKSIQYCLHEAGISMKEVSAVAINSDARANRFRKCVFSIIHRPDLRLFRDRLASRHRRGSITKDTADALNDYGFRGKLHHVEHHTAHLASTFFTSPFESALMLSVDGFGDFSSTAWGLGGPNGLRIDRRIHFPHSLGIFYETMTRFLGFNAYGDEYKVMGLSAYGSDKFRDEMSTLVEIRKDGQFSLNLDYFNHHLGTEVMSWNNCVPVTPSYFTTMVSQLLGKPRLPHEPITQRHKDIASSAQAMYERVLFHLIRHLHEMYNNNSLVLGGGCAFNSLANGRIITHTPIKSLFVQPAAGDAGGALGAALYVWSVRMRQKRSFSMNHAYWGPSYTDSEIEQKISNRTRELAKSNCNWQQLEMEELLKYVASRIAAGKVVGWFQGRMEWGPRALGNRSILCDPRRTDMKDILNKKIKCREAFRPFAPSILRNAVDTWFETDDSVPFMMKVLQIRETRRKLVPAVCHIDGSGRLQTVEHNQNPIFYRLIEAFNELTGVPMLLNTSFNQSEPIVCTVDQAVNCFLRTHMDLLVMGHHVLSRSILHSQRTRTDVLSEIE